jgi:hypothetical protein
MIQPFDNGKFDKRFDDVFDPAVRAAGLYPYRVDRDPGVSVPIDDIERNIREAIVCFVDVTTDNPNVWFELGYAIAAGKDLCLACSKERDGAFPFDIRHRKIITYSSDAPRDFKVLGSSITERLQAILMQQEIRADIQAITKEQHTAGLTDYEAAMLACIASGITGINDSVSNWWLKTEMEKTGYNSLASNVALRGLQAKAMLKIQMVDGQDEQYEAYAMNESGWEWISKNTHSLNLKALPKSLKNDEIPF